MQEKAVSWLCGLADAVIFLLLQHCAELYASHKHIPLANRLFFLIYASNRLVVSSYGRERDTFSENENQPLGMQGPGQTTRGPFCAQIKFDQETKHH